VVRVVSTKLSVIFRKVPAVDGGPVVAVLDVVGASLPRLVPGPTASARSESSLHAASVTRARRAIAPCASALRPRRTRRWMEVCRSATTWLDQPITASVQHPRHDVCETVHRSGSCARRRSPARNDRLLRRGVICGWSAASEKTGTVWPVVEQTHVFRRWFPVVLVPGPAPCTGSMIRPSESIGGRRWR
jgi:hypothetical protein